ncbi:MAG: DNA photolyase family protein [Solirubrobacteraceae bacterium]|jgi:deoxyribodipyrimidine photo-lyase|nr:DNA photolyase family protein [Solirubrobacteraceae bacterium]
MASTAIVWLRRDLRVHDHPALHAAAAEFEHVVPLFVADARLTGGRFASAPRAAFLRGCLADLDAALAERGAGLVVRDGRPEELIPALAAQVGAAAVLWTSDVSPFARARDRAVTAALSAAGIAARPCPGNYLADISRPRTKTGKPFTVFTPFWKAERELERRSPLPAPGRLRLPAGLERGAPAPGPELADVLPEPFTVPGETAGRAAMAAWLDGPVDAYAARHDDLSGGTSGLSPHLRWGTISPRELEQRTLDRGGEGAAAFARQLAWRDFYAHVLLSFPDNARLEFQPRFRALAWHEDAAALRAWQEGRTGYPLVDAGMRQLAATGWMHNRARMVVGSFLTKDLHLDWRAGEAWFARLLLDGEPAQNNGNWQWIASTGVDPAPYFRRIFNPVLQQRKFDPQGAYVRRWVPELANVPLERLAEPWSMSAEEQAAAGCVIGRDYPAPIVDHAEERRVAIDRYRAVSA